MKADRELFYYVCHVLYLTFLNVYTDQLPTIIPPFNFSFPKLNDIMENFFTSLHVGQAFRINEFYHHVIYIYIYI